MHKQVEQTCNHPLLPRHTLFPAVFPPWYPSPSRHTCSSISCRPPLETGRPSCALLQPQRREQRLGHNRGSVKRCAMTWSLLSSTQPLRPRPCLFAQASHAGVSPDGILRTEGPECLHYYCLKGRERGPAPQSAVVPAMLAGEQSAVKGASGAGPTDNDPASSETGKDVPFPRNPGNAK